MLCGRMLARLSLRFKLSMADRRLCVDVFGLMGTIADRPLFFSCGTRCVTDGVDLAIAVVSDVIFSNGFGFPGGGAAGFGSGGGAGGPGGGGGGSDMMPGGTGGAVAGGGRGPVNKAS